MCVCLFNCRGIKGLENLINAKYIDLGCCKSITDDGLKFLKMSK